MNDLLLNLFKGALIGTGAILPGVSGGVLCVALGIYHPMMTLLAHPYRELRRSSRLFLPLLMGFALGVLGLSRLVDWLFRASPVPAVWLFVGLIVGSMPALWRDAGQEGRPPAAWVALGAAFTGMLVLLLLLQGNTSSDPSPTIWTWLLCGALWGVGLIAPGMSPSSLFIFMGVYQPMAAGIADLSLPILLPMGAGLILCVLVLSRVMNGLLRRFRSATLHAILGAAIASTVMIVPRSAIPGWLDAVIYALCFVLGLLLALWMGKLDAGEKE